MIDVDQQSVDPPQNGGNIVTKSADSEDDERRERGKIFTRQNTFTLAPSGDEEGFASPRAQVLLKMSFSIHHKIYGMQYQKIMYEIQLVN
jgi:hypothetical protein